MRQRAGGERGVSLSPRPPNALSRVVIDGINSDDKRNSVHLLSLRALQTRPPSHAHPRLKTPQTRKHKNAIARIKSCRRQYDTPFSSYLAADGSSRVPKSPLVRKNLCVFERRRRVSVLAVGHRGFR